MVRWSLAVLSLLAATLLLGAAAAAGGGCSPQDTVHTRGDGTAVEVKGCKFAPVILFAPVGATVTWKNVDQHPPHNIHGLGWGMTPGTLLQPGGETTTAFDRPGIYPYQCSLHPGMSGIVIVGDGQVSDTAERTLVAGRTTQRDATDPVLAIVAAAALAATALGAYRIGRQRSNGDHA